jgi:hypothetical protein
MAKEKVFEEQSQEIKELLVADKVAADEKEKKESTAVDKALAKYYGEKKERVKKEKIKKERKRKAKVDRKEAQRIAMEKIRAERKAQEEYYF